MATKKKASGSKASTRRREASFKSRKSTAAKTARADAS
jgi:hypothetical protein